MEPQIPSLVEGWNNPDVWTTRRVAPRRQFDYWRDFVVDAHMRWAIRPIRCDQFPAFIRQGRFDGFRVTHLTASQGGIVGTRGPREIAQDSEALYNLIYIAEGSICLMTGDQEISLSPGTFALWDTTRPMTFITGAGLRQITFAVPQAQLHRVLPRATDFVGSRIKVSSGLSQLFIDHVLSLDASFGELPRSDAGHILNAAMELLAATLSANFQLPAQRGSFVLLRQVMAYVDQHLDDPELSNRRIATANGITERHLHRLFEQEATTPASWVRGQRLDRCRRDLGAAASGHLSITEIAYRWGFRDSGTFSKIFRREFGECPRELRRLSQQQA